MSDPLMMLAVVLGLLGGLLLLTGTGWFLLGWLRGRPTRLSATVSIALGLGLCGTATLMVFQVALRPREKTDYEKSMDQKVESGELGLEVDLDSLNDQAP